MLIAQFIEKEIVNYGLLKITQKGRDYYDRPYSFMLTKES
jgi:hypothetical protein